MAHFLTEEEIHARRSATERLETSGLLNPYVDIILGGRSDAGIDWQWVATAPEGEIIRWAEDVRDSQRDKIAVYDPMSDPMEEDWE